jgi:hypothetical protein
MRFMVMVRANKDSEAGLPPSPELVAAMGEFNKEMLKAGIFLAGEGLHPSSKGARVRYEGKKHTVIDGPFTEAKELIAGYWLIQVKSKEEAIEWMKRAPAPFGEKGGEVEIRQVYDMEDFPAEVQAAAKDEIAMRAELTKKRG